MYCHRIATMILLIAMGCKSRGPANPSSGEWNVTRCELYLVPEEKYRKEYERLQGTVLAPYMQLRYVFRDDSTFERTMKNGAHSMSLTGRILYDTSGKIENLVFERKDDKGHPTDTLPVSFVTRDTYKIMEMMEMGFVDQYINRAGK